jgi:hypothetical protein
MRRRRRRFQHGSAAETGEELTLSSPDASAGTPLERASFSSIAFVTKSITDVSAATQSNFSSRCSDFGMRVANCVQGSSAVAIYAALFFDPRGRPGPRLRLRRRRPFFARGAAKTLPNNDWIAERTSCCTRSRITVNKLFRLGIKSPFPAADTGMPDDQQRL